VHTSRGEDMHSRYEVECSRSLPRDGTTVRSQGRLRSIAPRSGSGDTKARRGDARTEPHVASSAMATPSAYSYLLGIYLGDGYISKEPRTYRLRISQDQRYPELINLARFSIARVLGGDLARVGAVRCVGCAAVSAHWSHWPCLFPQHGPGRKHQRPIVLADWQSAIVHAYPRQLLRGLIHSDGCR
jgi:hypothetical protein